MSSSQGYISHYTLMKRASAPFPSKESCGFDFTQKMEIGETIVVRDGGHPISEKLIATSMPVGDALMIFWGMAHPNPGLLPRPVIAQMFRFVHRRNGIWYFEKLSIQTDTLAQAA